MRTLLLTIALLTGLALVPSSAAAATCSDYKTQADAQRAADTRDTDHNGVYCESLPCPCAKAGGESTPKPEPKGTSECVRPRSVQRIVFDSAKYPNIRAHFLAAVRKGWPRVMVVNRNGTGERRDRLLRNVATRPGFDRDEYPAAVGRGRANGKLDGLVRGTMPRGWKADVKLVPSSENRSHGSSLGANLRGLCDGTRFEYVFQ